MSFELLEHPADIGFRAFGGTLPELFANSANALLSIACELDNVRPTESHALSAVGSDYESLLAAWLNEVLYWFDGRRIVFGEFHIGELGPAALHATALGEPRDAARHPARIGVKAVTWHQLKVAPDGAGWMAEVYLDI